MGLPFHTLKTEMEKCCPELQISEQAAEEMRQQIDIIIQGVCEQAKMQTTGAGKKRVGYKIVKDVLNQTGVTEIAIRFRYLRRRDTTEEKEDTE